MASERFLNLPEEKKRRIINAAREELSSVPYDELSINRIVKAAGIPRGSFYDYFADKDDLIEYLMGDYCRMMEQMLEKKNPGCFKSYLELKGKIGQLYYKTCGDGVEKCFCHGDTYKPNWMITPEDEVILIDWEYSGYSDPGIDVGYYIVDAMYEIEEGKAFIREYLGEEFDEKKEFHFLAYTAIIAYYWFVWAMYRESCGAVMGEALYNWYQMAGKYADELLK